MPSLSLSFARARDRGDSLAPARQRPRMLRKGSGKSAYNMKAATPMQRHVNPRGKRPTLRRRSNNKREMIVGPLPSRRGGIGGYYHGQRHDVTSSFRLRGGRSSPARRAPHRFVGLSGEALYVPADVPRVCDCPLVTSLSFFLQGVGVGCPDPQAIGPPYHPLFY